MKKLLIITFLVTIIGSESCKKKELELFPYNQIETSQAFNTEADVNLAIDGMYAGLRTSGSYFVTGVWNILADALADNLISNKSGPGRGTLLTYSEWRYTGQNTLGFFAGGYTIVRRANAILENIDKFPDGTFKNNAKAQALALRGMVYFDMARVYSKTYTNATASDLTIPYVTVSDPTITPGNEPVKSFYDKLVADLETAKSLIGASNTVYRFNKRSVSGILSRLYLYRGEWANCITASTDALTATPDVPGRAAFRGIWLDSLSSNTTQIGTSAPGVLLKVRNTVLDNQPAQGVNYYQTTNGARKSEYVVEYNFKQLFTTPDIRSFAYIATSPFNGADQNHVIKYNGRPGDPAGVVDGKVLRTAEVLLNRAEANYRNNTIAAAKADLVLLKTNRYSPYDATVDNALSGQPLLDEILAQRRLELAFEGDRFWDLKRRNLPVQRDGTKGDKADGTGVPYVFTSLPAGDNKFQLPFPQGEVNFNTNLKQNPGY
jgi:hypothetical protein